MGNRGSFSMTETLVPSDELVRVEINGEVLELPVITGSENEKGIDITQLRQKTGHITVDPSYGNTGSCLSEITFIDGDKGILRYRGIPIEQLAEKSCFVETCYLIIFGELPNQDQLANFRMLLTKNEMLHEGMRHHFEGFPIGAHPMAILSAMINALSCYHPELLSLDDEEDFNEVATRLISKVRTIASYSYKKMIGQPFIYPRPDLGYCENLLHMMFSIPGRDYEVRPEVAEAMNLLLILHGEHEQNCSTSTVRMVGSSQANVFASCSAGVCALWGPLHGGANMAVIKMLGQIRKSGISFEDFIAQVKDRKNDIKLMGFGHRVYRNFDPRAKIIKKAADNVLNALGINDPSLELAMRLEEHALQDEYFVSRKLYPNVDFYSGIIMRALGIPLEMFTVLFAIGRMPGWIAQWKEVHDDPKGRIYRPRQIYTGHTKIDYIPIDQR
jgi:citrate synthase